MMKNKFVLPLILLISVLTWILAWPPLLFPFLLFFLLIPVIYLADSHHENTLIGEPWEGKINLFIFLYFLSSESVCMVWISSISLTGAFMTILIGSISKTLPVLFLKNLWGKTESKLSRNLGSLGFIGLWIILEWVQVHVLDYPWMNLGMGLSGMHPFIQWYEYTGSLGGSAWILALNLSSYELLKYSFARNHPSKLKIRTQFFIWAGLLIIPSIVSFMRYETYDAFKNRHYNQNYHNEAHFDLVQSNINPKTQKFDSSLWKDQFNLILELSRKMAHTNTEYILWPETALEPWHGLDEDRLFENSSLIKIRHLLLPYKNASLVTGALTYRLIQNTNSPIPDTLCFNSALQLGNDENIGIYHKQILVPGVEKSPWNLGNRTQMKQESVSPFMYLGGIHHYFNQDGNPKVLYAQSGSALGVLICFESTFGDYARKLCLQGAGILAVISNDAWWGNGPEPYQHLDYSRILAIENRRSVAQASNGGISFLINQTGKVLKEIPVSKTGSIEGSLNINEEITLYTQFGDWIAYPGLVLFLLASANSIISNNKNNY